MTASLTGKIENGSVSDETLRVQKMSNEEWLDEYMHGRSRQPEKPEKTYSTTNYPSENTSIYRFIGHRTTKKGNLVLVFDDENGNEAVAFFNVDVTYQRGRRKGQNRRTGHNGQFLPKPRSKFRKFWLASVGYEPRRWSKVHEELYPRLKNLRFKGKSILERDRRGDPYTKLLNVTALNIES